MAEKVSQPELAKRQRIRKMNISILKRTNPEMFIIPIVTSC